MLNKKQIHPVIKKVRIVMRRNKIYAADWSNGFGGSAYEFGSHEKNSNTLPLRFIGCTKEISDKIISELKLEGLNVKFIERVQHLTYLNVSLKK